MDDLVKERTDRHPCYNEKAANYGRIHIPVAPKCNISCNYCNRKFDCANECRPGVTSIVLTPRDALERYKMAKEKIENLSVVGIAGPGDALANFEQTKESIQLIQVYDPEAIFCLSTNGLMLPAYGEEIISLGIRHITITINAIDPEIGSKIYRRINYHGETIRGKEASNVLLNNQLEGLKYLSSKGALCKINIVVLKNMNENHIEDVVKKVKEYGAFMTNIVPHIPVKGSCFEGLTTIDHKELFSIRNKCEVYVKQMKHCQQCRADAAGRLTHDQSMELNQTGCRKFA
ncbi:MAG: radical SAM protein [Bacillota bacterium]